MWGCRGVGVWGCKGRGVGEWKSGGVRKIYSPTHTLPLSFQDQGDFSFDRGVFKFLDKGTERAP